MFSVKMTEPQMEIAAIAWLDAQSKIFLTRPKTFTPQDITSKIGGYAPTLGKVADKVIRELKSRGVKICYVKAGARRWFELTE